MSTPNTLFSADALAGRTALVTGASRGIGKDIATHLAQAGAYVIGTATSDSGADAISARLGEQGHGLVLNTADSESIDALVAGVKDKAPDILVNNAGITRDNLLMRMKDDEWDAVLATNLSGVFRLTKSLLRPMMKKRFGRIISVGSVVGTMGNPGQANYAAAKAGLIGFTKSLARELGARGITANVIAPGFIATDMTDALNETQREVMLSQVPVGTLGQTSDIANMAVFLASDAAGYITGETLHVNGGMLMP
ncbi:MAG: 3-oxoacyl-ACP reductase FabG [Pseudomonadota bacterium]